MTKRKTCDWFSTSADRISSDTGELLVSVPHLSTTVGDMVGHNCPIPLPFESLRGRIGMSTIELGFQNMFAGLCIAPQERTCAHSKKKFTTPSFSKPEVFEWFWHVIVSYINARIKSVLPRTQSKLHANAGLTRASAIAHDGSGWPTDDNQWTRAESVIMDALPTSSDGIKEATIDAVVDYVSDMCMYAVGVRVDKALLHEHIGLICLQIESSIFLAKTFARSTVLEEVLGSALSAVVRRRQFENDWMISCCSDSDNYTAMVVDELVATRKTLINVKIAVANRRLDQVRHICGDPLVMVTSARKRDNWRADKNHARLRLLYDKAVLLSASNITFSGGAKSFAFITELALRGSADVAYLELDRITSDKALRDFILLLDEAIELYIRTNLQEA